MADKTNWPLILAIGAIVYFISTGAIDLGGILGGETTDGGITAEPWIPDHLTEDTTVTMVAVNKFKPTTAVTGGGALVYKDGANGALKRHGNVSMDSGTFTATPGDDYIAYFGFNDESGAYYTQKMAGTVGDRGTLDLEGKLVQIDTAITMTWKDKYGTVTTALAIGSDETYNAKIYLQVASDKGFGNSYTGQQNTICFVGNSTSTGYSSIKLHNADPAPTPNSVQKTYITNGTRSAWCWYFPVLEDLDTFEETVEINALGNPTSTDTIEVVVEDVGLTLNEDTGAEIIGTQDEDLNDLGSTVGDDEDLSIGVT